MRWLRVATVVGLVVVFAAAFVTIRRLDSSDRSWVGTLENRFYLGVPWGTLVVASFVVLVYLVVQDGRSGLDSPVVIPYRAWSYAYPLGMLTASFSHASFGHVLGNMSGTLVAAPIAEYAWGHKPAENDERTLRYVPEDPRVRAFVVFPAAVIAIGLLTSLLSVGPVIGFSSVVFAFAGFALVFYPILTIVAVIGVHGILRTVINTVFSPIVVATAEASGPSAPSWATIAIQGHAIGFFFGLFLGIVVIRHRGRTPDPLRLWVAVVIFGFARSLWAIYWFGGENTYILLRAPGVVLVVALSIVVVLAVVATDRSILPDGIRRWRRAKRADERDESSDPSAVSLDRPPTSTSNDDTRPVDTQPVDTQPVDTEPTDAPRRAVATRADSTGNPDRSVDGTDRSSDDTDRSNEQADQPSVEIDHPNRARTADDASTPTEPNWFYRSIRTLGADGHGRSGAAVLVLLLVFAAIAGPALALNATVVDTPDEDATLTVEDYHVTYAEGVENELVSVVPIERFGADETLTASGVIVWSEERSVWTDAVTARSLAFSGERTIDLGGIGWRETVVAERSGWSVAGNDTVYQVHLSHDDERALAFESDPQTVDGTIADTTIALASIDGTFTVETTGPDGATDAIAIPEENESVSTDHVRLVREDDRLYAEADGTRMLVASAETYN